MLYFFIPCSNVPDNSITWSLLISTNIEIFPLSSCCFTISCLFLHQLFCLSNLSALTISRNQPKERGKWVDVIDVYISTCIYYTLKTHTLCALHFFLVLHTCVSKSFLLVLNFVMKPVFKIVNFYFLFLQMKTHCFCLTLTQLYFKDNATWYFDSQSKLPVLII